MALDQRKYERKHTDVLRDIRPMYVRLAEWLQTPSNSFAIFFIGAGSLYFFDSVVLFADLLLLLYIGYFIWLLTRDRSLAFKLPMGSKWKDSNNMGPGRGGKPEGILYLGNVDKTNEEIWFSNSDARTHVLFLGTTGSGKTEGLKSMVTNAMTWASGFVYVDGKADTDLWSSLSSLVRRFGRDDDLMVLNYMTGNSDTKAPSNTMNPFSSGSASYLTNMLVSLMPDAEGDNAMWKERAVSLISSVMPALTWKRDNQDIPMSVSTIREFLTLPNVIKLARDPILPPDIKVGLEGYLDTLPGFIADAYDDQGQVKPPGPDQPQYDTTTASQQHGYLSMQFTRALQSLGDEYGYIFDTQAADVDMVDVVLNRRILVVLIPALEKSSDETANLGKIVAATIKGMMGSSLGATVEGESATVIENKPTQSSTPFMTIFDEVGYYTSQGMAVMAAQARSLGFCLIYAAQDLPALEKRVKEEARSITANCNIKIFGKLEDPTQTKEFFEKTVGSAIVMESSGFQLSGGASTGSYYDNQQASMQIRPRASYDGLRGFTEGQAIITFGEAVMESRIFYSNPGFAKAMRVTRFVALPPPDENLIRHAGVITKVRDLMVHKTWTALKADVALDTEPEIAALAEGFDLGERAGREGTESGMISIAGVYGIDNPIEAEAAGSAPPPAPPSTPPSTPPAAPPQPEAKTEPSAPSPVPEPTQQQTPEPPPAATPPAEPEPQASEPPADEGGNPLGFFAKKPAGDTDNAPPPAPVQPETPPAAQHPETPPTAAEPPPQAAPPPAEQKPAAPVDPEAEKTLKKAGEDAAAALFKRKDTDDDAAS
ncbi:MAG: type IV secretion system DNA-binding domain-containing protein [Rhodospirillales bacterium]|nr:type IV secretion system DNA-binding domain-containing protein [Rhodospirillales bacterium]MCB9996319.1 type IV secretion system DNA-binding domain-containing protein [Rhodospirillales bacterium]